MEKEGEEERTFIHRGTIQASTAMRAALAPQVFSPPRSNPSETTQIHWRPSPYTQGANTRRLALHDVGHQAEGDAFAVTDPELSQ